MSIQQLSDDRLRKNYPLFETELVDEIEVAGEFKTFKANEVLMRKGQFIRNTMLVLNGMMVMNFSCII